MFVVCELRCIRAPLPTLRGRPNNFLDQPCFHLATSEEQQRDPMYQICGAEAGEACIWARRYDGVADPHLHSERLEAAMGPAPVDPESRRRFDEEVLATGLV